MELEGPADVLREIETEVNGDRLIIGKEGRWMDWNWSDRHKINVYITMPVIEDSALVALVICLRKTRSLFPASILA